MVWKIEGKPLLQKYTTDGSDKRLSFDKVNH